MFLRVKVGHFGAGASAKVIFPVLLIMVWTAVSQADTLDWQEQRGDHFIVYYLEDKDSHLASQTIIKAEEFYRQIDEDIGYSRYSNFWTWENRVKIFIFPNKDLFRQYTGQPEWSHGMASSNTRLFGARFIVTYSEQKNFFDGLLPHEMSHLMLHDFLGSSQAAPLWFDEGMAQLLEEGKLAKCAPIVRYMAQKEKFFPFEQLNDLDIRQERNNKLAVLFYAQGVSVVDFIKKQYGRAALQQICRGLKEGRSFEEALRVATSQAVPTMKELERKWLNAVK